MTIPDLLKSIGLSQKESTIYLTLLRHGNQTTSYLAKKANMNRGTTFVILHQLLEKGLVTKTIRNKIQYFSAIEPKKLINYLEHKELQIKTQKEKVTEMMEQLTAITNPHASRPKIKFFEGPEGARTAFEDTFTAKNKELKAFLSITDVEDFLGSHFFQEYTSKRIEKGYTLKAIRTFEKDKEAFQRNKLTKRYKTSRKERREVRYISDDLAFPMTMYMYDNKVLIISSKEEGFAVIIESKELAEMQKKLFNLIWKSSRS